jgi:hypothetical protein
MSFVRRQRRSYLCCVGGHHRFRDSGPKRLRASGRDGGTVMTRPRHPSQCSFPVIQVAASSPPSLGTAAGTALRCLGRQARTLINRGTASVPVGLPLEGVAGA